MGIWWRMDTCICMAESLCYSPETFQFNSVTQLCPTLCDSMDYSQLQASLSITNPRSLLKLMFTDSMMPSNHLNLCHPGLLPPSIFPSIRVFSNESVLPIRWPKYWSFSFSISPSSKYSGLISFRIDWLISLLSRGLSRVFSNTKGQKHQFFSDQLFLQSNSHIHTWLLEKIIALIRRTFVGKRMSLLFNMPSRLVITFLSRSKCLLISWLQSPSAVILKPK